MPQLLEVDSNAGEPADSDSARVARDQIRGSSLFMAGNLFSTAVTFLPHLLLVRYLSTEAFGHLAYALSLIAVGKTYALGFNEAMSRFVPIYHTKREPSKALGSVVVVFAMTLLISGVFVVALAAASGPILGLLTKGKEPAGLVLILMFLIPMETTDLLIMNLFACFARSRPIFWGRYIIPPGLRVIVIVLVVFRHLGLRSLADGYLAAELIIIVPFGIMLVYELRRQQMLQAPSRIRFPIREIFGFSVPLMASNVVGMIGSSIPVLLLGYFHSMSMVAYFRVVLPVATLSNMVLGNFMPLYLPAASRLFAKQDIAGINQLFWRTSLWMSVLAFPIFLATGCFARPLTIFLYGVRYAPSAPIMAVISFGYFFNVIFAFNTVTLKVLGKIRLMVILNLVTPVFIVLFNLLLIPHYGAIGAAVGTAAGVILQNFIRQVGLWLGSGGVSLFERQYISFFLALGLSALGLYLIQLLTPINIYFAATLAFSASALVLWLVKKHLKIADTFPEVLRLPLLGRLLA